MSKLTIVKEIADHFASLAVKLDEGGYTAAGDAMAAVYDLLNDLYDSGIDPDDYTQDQNELIRDVTNVAASFGATIGIVAITGAGAASAAVLGTGIILAVTAFALEEATQAFLTTIADEWGITPIGVDIDASSLEGPLRILGTIVGDTIVSTPEDDELVGLVRRQGFWNQWLPKLRECSAHLVDCIMRRVCCDASVAFQVSFF